MGYECTTVVEIVDRYMQRWYSEAMPGESRVGELGHRSMCSWRSSLAWSDHCEAQMAESTPKSKAGPIACRTVLLAGTGAGWDLPETTTVESKFAHGEDWCQREQASGFPWLSRFELSPRKLASVRST